MDIRSLPSVDVYQKYLAQNNFNVPVFEIDARREDDVKQLVTAMLFSIDPGLEGIRWKRHFLYKQIYILRLPPAGAYYAVSNDTPSASRTLLYGLLRAEPSETISSEKILAWADTSDINTALNLLYRLQRLEFLYGDEEISTDDIHLTDEQLPTLLEQLSNSGKALLADENGLYFANANFHHEAAEELGLLASVSGQNGRQSPSFDSQ